MSSTENGMSSNCVVRYFGYFFFARYSSHAPISIFFSGISPTPLCVDVCRYSDSQGVRFVAHRCSGPSS